MSNEDTHRDAADRVRAVAGAMLDNKLNNLACLTRIREIVGTGAKGRRIVQIAVRERERVALCDDGTLWVSDGDFCWVRLDGIPQDAPAESPDPIAELEELGARLDFKLKPDLVCWTLVDDLGRTTLVEEMVYPFTVDSAREAGRRLLARVRGAR